MSQQNLAPDKPSDGAARDSTVQTRGAANAPPAGAQGNEQARFNTGFKGQDGLTFAVVVLLMVAAAAFLNLTISKSADLFGHGIAVAERYAEQTGDANSANHQIFVLALAHEIVTFKATALFVGAIIAILGALFVLRTGQSAYDASISSSSWKLSLGTTSPGLVMISLGCLLVAIAVLKDAHAYDGTETADSPSEMSELDQHKADFELYEKTHKNEAEPTQQGGTP